MTMTLDEQASYYGNLLAIQYRCKRKAQATMTSLALQALCNNLPLEVKDAFNIAADLGPLAAGAQLDIVGKYVGVSRRILTLTGGVSLSDANFLTLIYLKIALNNCDGTLYSIETLLNRFFGGAISIFDNSNMTLGYFMNSSVGSQQLLESIIELDLLPRPTGVGLAAIIMAAGLDNYFALSSYYEVWPSTGLSAAQTYYGPGTTYFTGNTHSSTLIDGIADTTGMIAGNPVGGAGIPPSTFILSVDGPTQIHITNSATATVAGASLLTQPFCPWINASNVISL